MTLYLTTGQYMRLEAPHIREQRRYFATQRNVKFPTIDTADWYGAPSLQIYDPDTLTSPWFEITDLVDDAATKLKMTDDGLVSKWQVDLKGWGFNSSYIGHDQGVLCLRRLWPDVENADGWSNWRLWWLGYFKADTIHHDYRNAREWTAVVEGISQYADKTRAAAVVLRRTDLSLNQQVTTSPLLADMREEANKGEFLGLPENSGQNLVDGDDAVPCISANEPTAAPEPMVSQRQDGSLRINEVFLRPLAGYGQGYQWIEIHNTSHEPVDLNKNQMWFYDASNNRTTTNDDGGRIDHTFLTVGQGWQPSGAGLAQAMTATQTTVAITNGSQLQGRPQIRIDSEEMTVGSYTDGSMAVKRDGPRAAHASGASIDVPGGTGSSAFVLPARGYVIFCENRRRFEELFSVPAGAIVVQWDSRLGRLDETQGRIELRNEYGEIDRVTWGTGDDSATHTPIDGIARTAWNGVRVPVPPVNYSFRRIVAGGGVGPNSGDSHSSDDWRWENVPTPGRRLAAVDDSGNQLMEDTAWFRVQLATLTCELTEDLINGATTMHVNNTHGFYGRIQRHVLIVSDIVDYDSKTGDTITLSSAWAGSTVPAGTRLYPVDDSGVAHDSWPLGIAAWARKQEPVPAQYDIYVSDLTSPVLPSDGEWNSLRDSEWTRVVSHRAVDMGRLTQNVNPGDQTVQVDSTEGWPAQGTLTVRWPNSDNTGQVTKDVRYRATTATSVSLSAPWQYETVPADNAVLAATVSPGLTMEHSLVGPDGSGPRARHILMVVAAMSNLGRFKLNAFRVYPNMAAVGDDEAQVDGRDVTDLVRFLLVERFGLPEAKFTTPTVGNIPIADGGLPLHSVTLPSVSTRETTYTNLARDFAEATANHLRWGLADGARWRPVPELYSVSGDDEDIDFTFTKYHYTLLRAQRAERNMVAQVRLRYRVSGTLDTRWTAYPSTAEMQSMALNPYRGAVYDVPKVVVVPSSATADKLARIEFFQRAYPVRLTIRIPCPVTEWLHPLAVVGLEDVPVDTTTDDIPNPTLVGRYKVTAIDESRSGQFPNETSYSDVSLEKLGIL